MLRSYDLAAIMARLAGREAALDALTQERQAAVAAILRAPAGAPGTAREPMGDGDPGEAELLLIRRAEHPRDPWSGHMALPGGRRDATDASLLDTAIRETREEVGIDLEARGTLLARLPDLPAVARGRRVGLIISPFVFALRSTPELTLSNEVAEALWTPLGPLARGERASTYAYTHEGNVVQLPCLLVDERVVWGLTYRMLEQLFEVLHR
ncbi:NUDIX hydrolase [Sorangium cellulosum]|uniref:Coenzyme A pyrophosphatase n=1 Tax=Sorangium cellulosum TaxID=56 RepID=A0A150QY03_SORCE|nr:CoA pyrophosphatase [Sorangium cellulosum]KYF72596.1 coenzyme A pyrophosphatase [Sorangium cellulosum]